MKSHRSCQSNEMHLAILYMVTRHDVIRDAFACLQGRASTALMMAVKRKRGNCAIIKILLEHGAYVNAVNKVITLACCNGVGIQVVGFVK